MQSLAGLEEGQLWRWTAQSGDAPMRQKAV